MVRVGMQRENKELCRGEVCRGDVRESRKEGRKDKGWRVGRE